MRKASPGVAALIDTEKADAEAIATVEAGMAEANGEESKEEEAKGALPNTGNGGQTDKY